MGLVCGKPASDVPAPGVHPKLGPKTPSEEEGTVSMTTVQVNKAKFCGTITNTQIDTSSQDATSSLPSSSSSSSTPVLCSHGRIERDRTGEYCIILPVSNQRWELHLYVDNRSLLDGTDYIHGDGETQVKIHGRVHFLDELATVDLNGSGGSQLIDSNSSSPTSLHSSRQYTTHPTAVEVLRLGMLRVIEEMSLRLHVKGVDEQLGSLILKGSASWRVEQREPEYKVVVVPPSPVVANTHLSGLAAEGVEIEMDLDHHS